MINGWRMAAQAAQTIGQALTAWAVIVVFLESGIVGAAWLIILGIALALPLRANGSDRNRAYLNFASGMIVWGLISMSIFWTMLEKMLFGDPGFPLNTVQLLLLGATVMHMFAGGFFFVLSRDEEDA